MILENKKILTLAIVIHGLFYLVHLKYIHTSYWPFLISLGISIAIYFFLKFKRRIELRVLDSVIVIYLFTITLIATSYLLLFSFRSNFKSEIYHAEIKSYYSRRVDGIIFDFKGKIIDRPFSIDDKLISNEGENFSEKYNLKLKVKEQIPGVYYVESMQLVPIVK